jgi:hypothetical protein
MEEELMFRSILYKLSKVVLSLLLINNAWAFDSSSAYNVVAMSFPANQMIFNRVVLDATQKAQTSVTFTADVQNGGGRPTHTLSGTPLSFSSQTDSAFIRLRLYDTAGTLINTVTSPTYILRNLGSDPNNQFSTKPGDNLHPWTLASVTYTGDLSNVRFVQLEMVGTDGAFWAGNYGPMWRVPTVTFGADATNTVYNPEFGIAPNSVRAQGWFNSSNSWAVCGVTSGSVPCVTAVAGVNANMWGGGYDINGGSLAGAVGGYDGTLSSTTADNAAATGSPVPASPPPPPPPAPTAIFMNSSTVNITRAIPTTNNSPPGEGPNNAFDNNPNTKYLNFDKKNAGVTVQLNTGRVVTGFTVTTANDFSGRDPTSYKLYGSNDGVTWTLIKEGALSLSNNRFTTSSMIDVANTTAYVYYFMLFPTTKAGEGCGLDCDSMQIAELTFYYDANNPTTSTASSNTIVDPVASASTPVYRNSAITSQQATRKTNNLAETTGHNAQVDITGDGNDVYILQAGSGGHFASVIIQGNSNNIDIKQTSVVGSRHYLETNIIGNSNIIDATQSDSSKTKFVSANGNNNTITTSQTGTGNHFLDLSVTGNGHTAGVTQRGSGNHEARITLDGTQPWNFSLTQDGSTGKKYTLPHDMSNGSVVGGTCSAIGGCNLTINQSN